MLTRLIATDIRKLWPGIERAIDTALDRDTIAHENSKNRILRKILEGRIVCWVSRKSLDGPMTGLIMTAIMEDDLIASRSLLIYLMSTLGNRADAKEWTEAMQALRLYAESVGCRRFVFYTRNPKLVKAMQLMEPRTVIDYSMVVIDI
jgi:hypothetical protein